MSTVPIVASARDVPDAIRRAERNPNARSYVARRAAALGHRDLIPRSWGLTAAVWDGSLHPRGRDGKFITKFAILNIFDGVGFDKPSWRGKAVGSGRRPNGKEFVTVRVTNSGNTRHAVGTDIDVDVDRIETAPISKTRFIPGDTVRAKSDRTEHRVAEIRDDGTVVSTDGTELAPGEFEMSRRIARDEEVTDDLEFAPSTEPSAADKYAAGDVIQAKPEREAFLPGSRAKTLTVAEYNPETNRVIATDADGNEVEVNPDDYNMARRAHREGDKIEPSRMPTGDMTITGPKTNQPGPNQAKLDAASAEVLDRELRDSLKSLGIDPDAPDDDIDPEYAQLSDAVYAELSNRGVPWETVDDGTEEFIQNEWDAGNRDPVSIADRAQDLIAYGYEPEGGWPDSIAEDIDALNEAGIDDDEEDGAPVDVGVDAFFATDRVNWLDEDVYPLEELVKELDAAGYGDAHDRLDAAHGELSTAVVGGRKVEIVDAYENAESVLKEVSNDLPGDDPFGDRIAEMGERIGNRAEALRRETAGMSADGPSTAHIHDIIDAFESGEDNPADYADQLDKWEKFATDSGDGNLRNRIQGVREHLANDTPADAGKPKVKPAWSGVPVEERPGWKDGTFGDTVYPSAEAAADAIEVEVGDGDPADVPDQIIPGNGTRWESRNVLAGPGENNPGIIRNGTYYERDGAGAWWSDPGTSSAKRADDETDASLDAAWDAYDPDGTVQKMRMDGARVALEQDIANLGAPRTEADADQMADRIAQDSILDETRAVELRDLARAAVVPEGPTLFDDAPAPAPKAVDSSHAAAVRLSLKNSAANKGLDVDVDGRLDAALANEDRDAAYKDVAKLMTELKLGGKQRTRLRGLLDSHFGDDGNDSAAVMAKETAANLAPDNPLKPALEAKAASRLASKPDGFGDYAGSSDRDLVEAWIQSRIDGDTPAGLSDELDARGIDVNVPNLDPNSFDDGTGPKLDPELDDWLNSGPDLTELSDADLAARRAQLETYSKEYKAAHGVAPGSDHALGLIKAEAVHRGSANSAPAGYDFESRGLDSVGGYYNARRSGDPAKIKAADEALRRRAAEIGMTDDQFHEWLDSREGRWYGDAVVSGNKNPYDEAVAKLRPHVAMPGDLESWADNHGPLDELSDADLADRRAQLEVYSKEHKDRYATAPGTDSLLGLVRSEQVRRGMAKNGAEAAGPGLPGVDGFAGPAPEPGAKVYAHPMGARIYVNPDGSMEAYGKDGKKKKTSATPEKLAAGHGAWQPMDAVGAEPGPKTGYESLTNEELKAAYTPGIFIPSGPAGKAAHDSNKQIEAELAKRGITKEPPAAAAARAPIDLDELSWSDPTDVELAGRTVPELEAVLERIRANLDKMSKAAGPLGPGAQISHDRQLKLRTKVESLRAKAVAAAPPSANSVYNSLRDDGMTADPGVAGDAFRKLYTQDSNAPQFTAKINGMEYTLSRDEVRALIGAPPEGKA